jgi:hypothetical protein
VTTSDAAGGGYTWEVSPTPTAETTLVNFKNESKEPHALIFARLGEAVRVGPRCWGAIASETVTYLRDD